MPAACQGHQFPGANHGKVARVTSLAQATTPFWPPHKHGGFRPWEASCMRKGGSNSEAYDNNQDLISLFLSLLPKLPPLPRY